MTLGLPGDLSRDSVGRAIIHAGHVGAWVYLGMGALAFIAGAVTGFAPLWVATALAVAMAALLVLVSLHRTVVTSLIYLVLGGAAALGMVVLAMDPAYGLVTTNNAIVAIPCVALVLVGGAGAGSVAAIAWVLVGVGVGLVATFTGAWIAEVPFAANVAALGMAAFLIVVRAFDSVTRRSSLRRHAALNRANVRAHEAVARRDHELEAITSLHGIAMAHLQAIAAAGSGPMDERRRAEIRQDLELVIGRDWVDAHGTAAGAVRVDPVATDPADDAMRAGTDARAARAVRAARDARAKTEGRDLRDANEGTDGSEADAAAAGDPRDESEASEASEASDVHAPNDRHDPRAARAALAERDAAAARRAALDAPPDVPTLDHAFTTAADEGLDVQMTGDLAVLGVLGPERAGDLDDAVAECLRNVVRHSGVREAELLLGHGGGEVTVAVMDTGVGFDPDAVAADRRGIRVGVRERVARHGGSARVWSAIGVGTTVVLTVPEGGS